MKRMAHMMSVGDAAQWMGVSEADLARLVERGRLRIIPPSNEVRVHMADLDACLTALAERPRRRLFSRFRRSA